MTNVLVMIPSGEVYDHDCVRWYNFKDIKKSINHYHNIGDAFVYDLSLKLLEFDKVTPLPIANPSMADIDRLREEYDYVFLRGSNYIHDGMKWQRTIEVLNRLQAAGAWLRHRCAGAGQGEAPALAGDRDRAAHDGRLDAVHRRARLLYRAGSVGPRHSQRADHRLPDRLPRKRSLAHHQAPAARTGEAGRRHSAARSLSVGTRRTFAATSPSTAISSTGSRRGSTSC